jgi:hypothetical protein
METPLARIVERRQANRHEIGLALEADVRDRALRGTLVDLSCGGAFIVVEGTCKLASLVELTLCVSEARLEAIAVGRVVRSKQLRKGIGIGIAFISRNECFRDFVAALDRASSDAQLLESLHSARILMTARLL